MFLYARTFFPKIGPVGFVGAAFVGTAQLQEFEWLQRKQTPRFLEPLKNKDNKTEEKH